MAVVLEKDGALLVSKVIIVVTATATVLDLGGRIFC